MANINLTTKEAIAEIKALIIEVERLKKEADEFKGSTGETFKNLETSTKKLKSQISLLGNRINYLQAIIKKQNTQMDSLTKSTEKNTKANKQNTTSIKQQTKASTGLFSSLGKLISSFGLIGGVLLFKNILNETYETIKTFDSLAFAMERITETTQDYESSQRFLLQLTRDYGVELVTTTNRWIKFLAAAKNAGLSLFDTEKIFRSMTKASSVLGLKTDELQGIYLALEQMLSKGKVTTEELRRQLGERLPGAMGIMAASIGVTIPKLDEMLRKGEVMSAEVLPNFADAVELAYGIETVDKVETLVSAQNRLTAAFQIFIKNISEGDGIIKRGLTAILNQLTEFVDAVNWIFSNDDQRARDRISRQYEYERKEMEKSFKRTLDYRRETSKQTEVLKMKINSALIKLERTSNAEERKVLKDHIDEMQRMIVANSKEAQEAMIESARNEVNIARARLEAVEKLRKQGFAAADKAEEDQFGQYNAVAKFARINQVEAAREKAFFDATGESVDDLTDRYVVLAAKYDLYRKLIDESDVTVIENENKKKSQREKILENILDLEKKIKIETAKTSIANNNQSIDLDSTGFNKKIELTKANNRLLNEIADIQYDIDVEKARRHQDKKNQELDTALRKGVKIIGDVEQQKLDLQKEYEQKVIIADEKRNQTILRNNETSSNSLMNLIDDVNEHRLKRIQDPYNKEVIEIKKVYAESAKTNKDRQRLEQELKRVAIESANAQIDAQIALLRAQLAVADNSQDTIDAIIFKINELLAAKKQLNSDSDIADSKEFWDKLLDLASEYNRAIGDLVDAFHSRRIENINAEIAAETEKYDKLIALAEGDDEQQKTLERNKEERIKQLEKRRLKEEQKQARARKAFAVADIGISTAQAIMRAYSDTGPIAGNVFAALVAALGAVQIAAVLAQPIPQYKDGGNITKDELAMINDGFAQEYVERNGSILTTKTKNALVDLKAGDVVYKDYDDMINNSLLIPNGISQSGLSESKFNSLFMGIEGSIERGFKKARININNNIIQKSDNSDYRDKLSRWTN